MKVVAACAGFEGVAPGLLNGLAVTGTSSPVAVNTGGALVDGKPYYNSASVNVTVATPATLTRIDRLVLRADWSAHTVRITRIAGSEGGSAPAITQTSGTTYDIQLAQVSITTGGVITVTDERTWARQNLSTMTGDVTITNAGVSAIGANKVLATMLGGVVKARQGGSATDWEINGTTDYTPTTSKIQVGSIRVSLAGGNRNDSTAVTFPVAFTNVPVVQLTLLYATGAISGDVIVPEVISPSNTGFTAGVRRTSTGAAVDFDVYWTATGI